MDAINAFLMCVMFCVFPGVFLVNGEDISIKIMVISELLQEGPCQPTEQCIQVQRISGMNVHANISWIYSTSPIQTILEGKRLFRNDADIVLISSHIDVFRALQPLMELRGIHSIHWPAKNIFSNAVPHNLLEKRCICNEAADVLFKLDCSCRYDASFIEFSNCSTWTDVFMENIPSRSLVIGTLISLMKTSNMFVLIQTDADRDKQFDISVLDRFNSKIIVYDAHALQSNDQIRRVLADVTEAQERSDVQALLNCDEECVMNILTEANMMSEIKEFESSIRRSSKWLIFADGKMETVTNENVTGLNNMAFVPLTANSGQKATCTNTIIHRILESAVYQLKCMNDVIVSKRTNVITELTTILEMYKTAIEDQILSNTVSTLMLEPLGPKYRPVDTVKGLLDGRRSVNDLFPNINKGFNGRKFTVGIITFPPFVIRENMNGSVKYSGYCIDLLVELAIQLNFTYTLTEPEDHQWGMVNPDGNWTGLVGLLQHKKVDIVVADLSIDGKRETVMDFTFPFYYEYVAGLLKKPDASRDKWKTYFNPFSWEVYIMIFATVPVSSFILCVLEKINPYYGKRNRANTEGLHRFQDSFWFILGALLSQGGVHRPDSQAGRTMVSFFCIFSIIILALYSGNLIAYLTVGKDEAPFTTVRELLKQDDYSWGLLNGTLSVALFRESREPNYKAIWDHIAAAFTEDETVLSNSNAVHLEKVRKGGYMYIGDNTQFENLVRNATECDLIIMEERLFPQEYGIGLQNNSPYKDIFSMKLMAIGESGLPTMWKHKWWQKTAICSGELIPESKPIYLIDIQSAFYFIGIGITIAGLILIIENIIFKIAFGSGRRQKQTTAILW